MAEPQADCARPSKRPRLSDFANPHFERYDASLWLADGNVILISADGKGFRVHQSVLSNHSQFFADMFSLALPENDGCNASYDCPSLTLAENGNDVSWFLRYFYTPLFFIPGKRTPYEQLAGMLRMSTKYLCEQLRTDVIHHLCLIYPPKSHILPPPELPECPALVPDENVSNHALLAIRMARENDVPIILPVAFYYAATIEPSVYVDLLPELSREDHRSLIHGREKLIKAVLKIAWSGIFEAAYEDPCDDQNCVRTRYLLLQSIADHRCDPVDLFISPMLHTQVRPAPRKKQPDFDQVCLYCYDCWKESELHDYSTVWKRLPKYFGLDGWPDNAPRIPWPQEAEFRF
ncbi:hypothetical protein BDZ89DRAFT_1074903 [Hymenopellis radicata]|nr:hypothetical protein BDZ89DRAFT_1074903 [Hymenopellis radicata]